MIPRLMVRAARLACALALCDLRFRLARLRGPLAPARRAAWMQQSARALLAALGIDLTVEGRRPVRGLVVSNHLGYLDIAIYAAAMPCCFVSKSEVSRWPVFGGLARAGATIFLDRAKRASASAVAAEMGERLGGEVPVVMFPEGTSTDGGRVLPFHPRLFQPAVESGAAIVAAAIGYRGEDGAEEREICWYGDAAFLPHLLRIMGGRRIAARIRFAEPRIYADARTAAQETQVAVAGMRAQMGAARCAELEMARVEGVLASS
jgi:lyso-ornithine lipid O-acyltransferase